MKTKKTKQILVGGVAIGGGADIVIQSMTNTDTHDVKKTIEQMHRLYEAGCQIVRVAIPDIDAARALYEIKKEALIPVVADIHFDYKLAIEAIASGVDKIRINPGNIGSEDRVKAVVQACRTHKIPIRIGVNSGSLQKEILEKYGAPTAEALVESANMHIELLKRYDFDDVCVSIKSSNVSITMKANILFSEQYGYPLHLGVTEAGTQYMGTVKSAAGIGGLLALGIGDTIRVSLTDDPVSEIYAAQSILKAVGLNKSGVTVVSCPTCGRTQIPLIEIANEVEKRLASCNKKLKVAVMGCVVNGPGEAREADIGIAGGIGEGLIFVKGKILKKVPQELLVTELLKEIDKLSEGEAE
ncbi:MAG: flavodoxin-dependent (E)-4-hydroxy-3-methylbut-2-enyl-diphosphate synthase [Clostridiales bacterium]|nr:flavodoxin-dependent (E)-4-hydroxy-3-methylbut-2-enyl-diphosphate synthase [Clostridiales bacterium]